MKYITYANWDLGCLEGLDKKDIEWVCGRLIKDKIGSSIISPFWMRNITKEEIPLYISDVHRKGIKFNYIMDSTCLGNTEFDKSNIKDIYEFIRWLISIDIDGITVSNQLLGKFVKKRFPGLSVGCNLSVFSTWIEKQLEYFNDPVFDWVILPWAINRYKSGLKRLISKSESELWLVANVGCLYQCPLMIEHANFFSHISNETAAFRKTKYYKDNYYKFVSNKPYYILRSPWIRPEDLYFYESLGFDRVVLMSNSLEREELKRTIKAYYSRGYDGNLFDILSFMGDRANNNIYADNKSLEGFIENFPDINCAEWLCSDCQYCIKLAERAVSFVVK